MPILVIITKAKKTNKRRKKNVAKKIFWWEQIILFANEFFVFSRFYTRCLHLLLSLKSYY